MGQDRVAVWPSPESSSPSPEGKRESGIALHPECPPAALWACALGVGLCPCKGLATWPFWTPPIAGLGTHRLLPGTQASVGPPSPPCAPSHP
uniref:Uncharacterized protein n=1 Tax=Mandrillus leucophaeus TaxID=9568 RepID=A0A2K5XVX0_MANLE